MTVIIYLLAIIIVTLEKFNNPIFAYNSYTYYNNLISDGWNRVVDENTFKYWSQELITNLLFFESEYQPLTGGSVLYDDVVM